MTFTCEISTKGVVGGRRLSSGAAVNGDERGSYYAGVEASGRGKILLVMRRKDSCGGSHGCEEDKKGHM